MAFGVSVSRDSVEPYVKEDRVVLETTARTEPLVIPTVLHLGTLVPVPLVSLGPIAMWLTNVPNTHQFARILASVLAGLVGSTVLVHLDTLERPAVRRQILAAMQLQFVSTAALV